MNKSIDLIEPVVMTFIKTYSFPRQLISFVTYRFPDFGQLFPSFKCLIRVSGDGLIFALPVEGNKNWKNNYNSTTGIGKIRVGYGFYENLCSNHVTRNTRVSTTTHKASTKFLTFGLFFAVSEFQTVQFWSQH